MSDNRTSNEPTVADLQKQIAELTALVKPTQMSQATQVVNQTNANYSVKETEKDNLTKVQEEYRAKENEKQQVIDIENRVTFLREVGDFANKNKDSLPPETPELINTILNKAITSELKECELKRDLAKLYFSIQGNFDKLNPEDKKEILKFKEKTDMDKLEKAKDVYRIFKNEVEKAQEIYAVEQRMKNNASQIADEKAPENVIMTGAFDRAKKLYGLNPDSVFRIVDPK
ncbi:MAG: hypothetical protein LBS34_00290 [Rickettsiales bacterium]|jgi:hypothetical protein|nr:hypothetical protein [Rickettsiales bacterium]